LDFRYLSRKLTILPLIMVPAHAPKRKFPLIRAWLDRLAAASNPARARRHSARTFTVGVPGVGQGDPLRKIGFSFRSTSRRCPKILAISCRLAAQAQV
jgi:hypothetical protein